MSKHTPGPWRVDPNYERDVQTADGAIEICFAEGVKPMGNNNFSVPQSMEEAFANARLIAAAPDLLEALKAIISDGIHCDVVPHLHRKALDAIAKATGETNA